MQSYCRVLWIKSFQVVYKNLVFNVPKHKEIIFTNKMWNRVFAELYTTNNGIRLDVDLIKCISAHNCVNFVVLPCGNQIDRTCCFVYCLGFPCLPINFYVPECSTYGSLSHKSLWLKCSCSSKTSLLLVLSVRSSDWRFKSHLKSWTELLSRLRMRQTRIFMKNRQIRFTHEV